MHSTPYRQRLVLQLLSKTSQIKTSANKGFTLVELLVVVIILAVLAAIAVPAFLNQQGRARVASAQTAAIDAARACAAAQVTNEQSTFTLPPGVTGACGDATADRTFGVTTATFGVATSPTATIATTGQVALTACSSVAGWAGGTTTNGCAPTRG